MDPFMALWVFLLGMMAGFLGGIAIIYRQAVQPWKDRVKEIEEKKRSLSSTYGKITEQFAPFMESYPFNWKKFRFIGSPIDGIQFDEEGIYLVEFKSAGGKLSDEQKKIKKMVEEKKVGWYVFEAKNGS
ncbi:MAG: Holliday junction resolvase-like protein [Candidatus Thermoplasmatota archaeon]|nr:Holliday junction resolvase-like protein [Candidatus Thermoplasmatota archaeon]